MRKLVYYFLSPKFSIVFIFCFAVNNFSGIFVNLLYRILIIKIIVSHWAL